MIPPLLYVDPGSGSYLIQALIAAVLGVGFFFKNLKLMAQHYWRRLFRKK